jgi:hypothetical protein
MHNNKTSTYESPDVPKPRLKLSVECLQDDTVRNGLQYGAHSVLYNSMFHLTTRAPDTYNVCRMDSMVWVASAWAHFVPLQPIVSSDHQIPNTACAVQDVNGLQQWGSLCLTTYCFHLDHQDAQLLPPTYHCI